MRPSMPLLRVEDIGRPGPELPRSPTEPSREPSNELERIRGRALERGSIPEELALALALELALTSGRSSDGR